MRRQHLTAPPSLPAPLRPQIDSTQAMCLPSFGIQGRGTLPHSFISMPLNCQRRLLYGEVKGHSSCLSVMSHKRNLHNKIFGISIFFCFNLKTVFGGGGNPQYWKYLGVEGDNTPSALQILSHDRKSRKEFLASARHNTGLENTLTCGLPSSFRTCCTHTPTCVPQCALVGHYWLRSRH